MKRSYIILVLLAAALIAVSVRLARVGGSADAAQNQTETVSDSAASGMRSDLLECIMTRTSVRSYTDQTVKRPEIETLLKAGMAAPSAKNLQPWEFVVITKPALLKQIAEECPNASMAAGSRLAIAVCGNTNRFIEKAPGYWVQDCSAATENILLAAHAMGLGAVWTGVHPVEERVKAVSRILNLPDTIVPLDVIVIGHPASKTQPKDKWNPKAVHYNDFKPSKGNNNHERP